MRFEQELNADDQAYAEKVYAELDHTRATWADFVAFAGLPIHPTAPMSYSIYQSVSRARGVCGCMACFDAAVPSRR